MLNTLNIFKLQLVTFLALVLLGCQDNNTVGSANTGKNNSNYHAKMNGNPPSYTMDTDWVIDNGVYKDSLGNTLKDMGWHLATLRVTRTNNDNQPIPVQGIDAVIYPKPTVNVGQKIEIQDINCDNAIFQKVGDSCSIYFKLSYDLSKGTKDTVYFPIQMYPKNIDMAGAIAFRPGIWPSLSIGNYRAVSPIETQYYAGSKIASYRLSYQIILMQNGSLSPISISMLQSPINPAFSVIHRTESSNDDPYYAGLSECALSDNPNLKQVNHLDKLTDSCILIYKAQDTSTRELESATIKIATNANYFFPNWGDKYTLLARYINGKPIPAQYKMGGDFLITAGSAHREGNAMVMDTAGTLSSGVIKPSFEPFRQVTINYNFKPGTFYNRTPYMPLYDGINKIIYLEKNRNSELLKAGSQIITDASTTNPVTVGIITTGVPASSSTSGKGEVTACGGAWTQAEVNLISYRDSLANNRVQLYVKSNSHGHCGGEAPAIFNADIPIYGYSNTIYAVDDQGCGGNQWDIGGYVSISGNGCNVPGDVCSYDVYVTATHGGLDGQCRESRTNKFTLKFTRPIEYLQMFNLSNFTPTGKEAHFVASGGKQLNAWLGTQGGLVAQTITCNSTTGICNSYGTYSNGLSVLDTSYSIGLQAKDILYDGSVNFTRSSGYDLSDFIISSY